MARAKNGIGRTQTCVLDADESHIGHALGETLQLSLKLQPSICPWFERLCCRVDWNVHLDER